MDAREPEARNGPLPQASPPIVSTQTEADDLKGLGEILQRINLVEKPTDKPTDKPADIALMRQDLINRCRFEAKRSWLSSKNYGDKPQFKEFDYWNRYVDVIYPDGRSSLIMHIPDVALEPEDGLFFGKQKILTGLSKADFAEPMLSKLQADCKLDHLVFEDVQDARNTDDQWWSRCWHAHGAFELIGAEPVGIQNGKPFYETRKGNRVKGTVACRMILKTVVLVGQEPDDNSLWRPLLDLVSIEAKDLRDQDVMPGERSWGLVKSQGDFLEELKARGIPKSKRFVMPPPTPRDTGSQKKSPAS